MSDGGQERHDQEVGATGHGDAPKKYTDAELDDMSRDELVKLGTELDDVNLAFRRPRWPVRGTRAERRAERTVAFWFALAAVSGLAFIGIFCFWPWKYKGRGEDGYILYTMTTPLYGLTLGLAVLGIGVGAVLFTKKFIPEELAIQTRHEGPSSEVDRRTTVALLSDALETSTLSRRKLITRTAGLSVGVVGVGALIAMVGGLVKNPWAKRGDSPLWVSGWTPKYKGETVYLRRDTGIPSQIVLVRPEDLDAGAMETVFPFRESERHDEEALLDALHGIRNAVMLIRLRPDDAKHAVKRKGQENFNYGDYWAYSKICTHLGCPTSLYEQQTNHILCPCHQSQFLATHYGKPIFGPAARALPQLPITVNPEGFLVANGDFIEPLGPAFWERPAGVHTPSD
ncbi:ubiquinol-cytochrome c reductase iron-sulfur subunit [Skermania sp. ID1734]|uniref:cytochrome bc1 complex Rieske iron-sulfur subunit n=1 Tax=Skermania sp. ID1734 TaxID=2597516 RepID=UPI00117EE192|nr:ubiquinol-cytochrome c reductase iron-sulfur subunit [Skermania sp. ID1734]TSE01186.1 ubiquinol-cytochrome c reductase iron-sulfur subunit [Skermania sp. ID1734]